MNTLTESQKNIKHIGGVPFEVKEVRTGSLRIIRDQVLGVHATLNLIHAHIENSNSSDDADICQSIKMLSRVVNSINCEMYELIGEE